MLKSWANEVFLHELGHHVHEVLLHPEAKAYWDSPWEAVRLSPQAVRDPAIDALDVTTQYSRTNEKEDFAESFVAFMADPGWLSKQAMFRMQRTLSLSGLYGKPVAKLGKAGGLPVPGRSA
jgi:hypothetical protein